MLVELQDAKIGHQDNAILTHVNLTVDEGEFIYLIGKVGSGKSTVLKTLYAELPLQDGQGTVLGFNLRKMKSRKISDLRKQVGIVFQDFQLLTDRTVRENLDFVLRATGHKKKSERKARIQSVLEEVELPDKIDSYPHELSGGEQQRIAIARAILNDPKIIFADEPTGNLDRDTGNKIITLLRGISVRGTAVVMSTHNWDFLHNYPGIVYRCQEGKFMDVTQDFYRPVAIEDIQETIEESEPPTINVE